MDQSRLRSVAPPMNPKVLSDGLIGRSEYSQPDHSTPHRTGILIDVERAEPLHNARSVIRPNPTSTRRITMPLCCQVLISTWFVAREVVPLAVPEVWS